MVLPLIIFCDVSTNLQELGNITSVIQM